MTVRADADLLAVRPKDVAEEVGGEHRDEFLFSHFSPQTNIGLMCEVKSGNVVNRNKIYLQRESDILLFKKNRVLL